MRRLSLVAGHLTETPTALEAAGKATALPEDVQKFLDTFRGLVRELTDELPGKYEQEPYVQEWIKRMLYYTIPGGKLNRGLTVLHSLEKLSGEKKLSEEQVFEAHVLGWAVEWLQAFFLISDDIMDQSVTRRGQPCYYLSPHPLSHPKDPKRPTVGTIAINDSFLVESHIYVMLRKHFRNQPFYADLVDLFHETAYQTELGQLLDLTSLRPGQLDFSSYTIDRYNLIVKYKTAFYSFFLPVCLALLLHNRSLSPEVIKVVKDVTIPMGEFFQVQDDYLDCYGAPEQIGKVGRDIEEAKCGWLIVNALRNCSATQRKELEQNYGKENVECVAKVKQIYTELNIPRIYAEFEERTFAHLQSLIAAQSLVPRVVFDDLLKKIYKRQK